MRKLLAALMIIAGHAYGAGCSGYSTQYDITISPNQISGTPLPNFTMLISGIYAGGAAVADLRGTGNSGPVTSALGNDITFNQAGTALAWNMPLYNPATGRIKANVLIPSAANGTTISMCVGNAAITTFQSTPNAYDSATNIALQFSATGIGLDSTGQNPTLTNHGGVHVSTGPTALVDAVSFAGAQNMIGGAGNFPTGTASRTVSFWMNPPTLNDAVVVGYGSNAGGTDNAYAIRSWNANKYLQVYSGQWNWIGGQSPVAVVVNAWHRWDFGFNQANGGTYIYLDSVQIASFGGSTPTTLLGSIVIGSLMAGGPTNLAYYTGQIADVKILTGGRSAPWMAAEYANETNPSGFYSLASMFAIAPPPAISGVVIAANSPLTVKATWTTDVISNSRVLCGTASGGPYTFVSDAVDPLPTWGVMAHSMTSNLLPNGSYYCVVSSLGVNGALGTSSQTQVTLPATPTSTPIALVGKGAFFRLNDRYAGTYGAPVTGVQENGDNNYGCWADDNNEYWFSTKWAPSYGAFPTFGGWEVSMGVGWVKMLDSLHTIGSITAPLWQNGVTNMAQPGWPWLVQNCISVNGSLYNHVVSLSGAVSSNFRSTNHYQSTISPQSNVGPDATYITNMTCAADVVTATTKYASNMTAQRTAINAPGSVAIFVEGAIGNVNGVHAVASNTATTISWAQSCTTPAWSWLPTGGTGSGGGTMTTYGWDFPTAFDPGTLVSWVQTDANDYQLGTKKNGMDAFAYYWMNRLGASNGSWWQVLCRKKVENFPLLSYSPDGCYTGKQQGDDGILDANWDYSAGKLTNATAMNTQFIGTTMGKGAGVVMSQYVTAFNRYLYSMEVSIVTDSDSGGTTIYEGGPYPWSPVTMIGDVRRNADKYPWGGPEFSQFVAKSQVHAGGVTSMHIAHSGNNFGGSMSPSQNGYTMYMAPDYQFAARGATVARSGVTGEVTGGMDLAYNFDGITGSLTMPNEAPADAKQRWAWITPAAYGAPMINDNYGTYWFSMANTAANGGLPSASFASEVLTTPYKEALPGPLTVLDCFGHYPTTLLRDPPANAIVLKKGTDLILSYAGATAGTATFSGGVISAIAILNGGSGYLVAPAVKIVDLDGPGAGATATTTIVGGVVTSINITAGGTGYYSAPYVTIAPTWRVSLLGTNVGNVLIPDNTIGCVIVRRDSLNKVSLYTSAGIGKSLPLTASATATVAGAWSASPLVMGDGLNSFWGMESLLRVWSRDLADDELISQMAVIRGVLWSRGKASSIP